MMMHGLTNIKYIIALCMSYRTGVYGTIAVVFVSSEKENWCWCLCTELEHWFRVSSELQKLRLC